jgi:hypothetical protein
MLRSMARLVPAGTPDPDGDRRFAERAFPLLEPLGWVGERHRGGYGVHDPGSVTTALGLIFGPCLPDGVTPRLEVNVGRRFVREFNKSSPLSLRFAMMSLARPIGSPKAWEAMRKAALPEPRDVAITIEGDPVVCTVLSGERVWMAHGWWDGYAVEITGDCIEPEGLRLRITEDLPPVEVPEP